MSIALAVVHGFTCTRACCSILVKSADRAGVACLSCVSQTCNSRVCMCCSPVSDAALDNSVETLIQLSFPLPLCQAANLHAPRKNSFKSCHVCLAAVGFERTISHEMHLSHVQLHYCRYTNKGRAYNPYAPSLGDTLNTAFISAVYANIPSSQISSNLQFRLNCWSRSQVRYVLGDAGRSLVSGWGKKAPTHVQVLQQTVCVFC